MGAGRPAGSSNKNKARLLRLIQEDYPEYDPLLELVKLAHDEKSTQGEKISCHKEVAQYVNPKLKAIEHTGDMQVNHNLLSKEEIIARVQAYRAAMEKEEQ